MWRNQRLGHNLLDSGKPILSIWVLMLLLGGLFFLVQWSNFVAKIQSLFHNLIQLGMPIPDFWEFPVLLGGLLVPVPESNFVGKTRSLCYNLWDNSTHLLDSVILISLNFGSEFLLQESNFADTLQPPESNLPSSSKSSPYGWVWWLLKHDFEVLMQ